MKTNPRNIRTEDYTYVLPEEKIARYPLKQRDSSKLLVYRSGSIGEDIFRNITRYLNEGDILVYNRTRVVRARLIFKKETGARIEIFCLEPENPPAYENNFSSKEGVSWKCLVGNRKKWKKGPLRMEIPAGDKKVILSANQEAVKGNESILRFEWDNKKYSFSDILSMAGHVPVPPYLNREDEKIDNTRYQTIYSEEDGSVAAPTAGLHFTERVMSDLEKKGIKTESITLHVGAGTFAPVKSETIGDHSMHIEHIRIREEMIRNILDRRVIAVGTTSLRTLESLYWIGHKISTGKITDPANIFIEQWYPYDNQTSKPFSYYLELIRDFMNSRDIDTIYARTGIIIVPGYKIRTSAGLITNYHMPGSTLLLLVAAFTGNKWKDIYKYSLENDFRFLSYGDSSLLLP